MSRAKSAAPNCPRPEDEVLHINGIHFSTLPKPAALKKIIRRKRKEVNCAPPVPTNLEEMVIPDPYKYYVNAKNEKELFLLGDSGPVADRILIFGRQKNSKILEESDHWFVDGTFRSTPSLFYQVYIIMAKKFDAVHSIIYGLLPGKSTSVYESFINMLKELFPKPLNRKRISCYFELAAINAFKDEGLLRRYNNKADFALNARMITSLAFVLFEDIDGAIETLSEQIPQELQPILNWFEDFYVERPNRRSVSRRNPMFPPKTWNLYHRVLNRIDRTNNHAEAAHRRLQNELSMDHPTLWKFLDTLKIIQKGRDIFYEQLVAGKSPPAKLKKYQDADRRIFKIVESYHQENILEYLRGLSHNYEMNP
ncbi:uncharacterized protein LOC135143846 [Zophobas morio]|uniref:uncharacterized protein LOC135143846 n=1 Tax=Zophobas morio TaxID=2755281 RepID=UPI003083B214